MRKDPLTIATSCVLKVYRLLLRLYPAAFYDEYGVHMDQVFRDMVQDAVRTSGWWGLFQVCGLTLIDLTGTLFFEHCNTLMNVSTKKLVFFSSFGAFYVAALPVWAGFAFQMGGPDFYTALLFFGLPALWSVPIMVLGISGLLLPQQRYTSIPYLVVSLVVIAYLVLFGAKEIVDIETIRTWGVQSRDLNRLFWGAIGLLGGMAFFQRKGWLGSLLLTVSVLYCINSFFWPKPYGILLPFLMGILGFAGLGVWLLVRMKHSAIKVFTLSWWAVGLQGLIVVLSILAVVANVQRPVRDTEAYKMAVGFAPEASMDIEGGPEAKEAVEAFIGKPLPDDADDVRMVYWRLENNVQSVRINFSTSFEGIRELVRSGVLCFKADIDAIPMTEAHGSPSELLSQGKGYQQHANPFIHSNPWSWVRTPNTIKGRCPLPAPYGIEIDAFPQLSDDRWVTIWGTWSIAGL